MTWALQDAKNRFSAVSEAAFRGSPQVVTRHGKPIVVVISYDLYAEKVEKRKRKTIWDAFRSCPSEADLADLIPKRAMSGRAHREDLHELFD